eukprot:c6009_g1_i1.p1 GENE.c6009_g1_i1~~c6009_g1_i1.p1  ORF type:complete len:263 (+),score=47.40 c6009_g1_i1:68-856(+)
MELSHIGKHCDHIECHQLDFLPFQCDACDRTYCLDHFPYQSHSCPIGRSLKNVECPQCPHCSQILALDPPHTPQRAQQALQKHISLSCPPETPKSIRCVVCSKKQLIPFKCGTCGCTTCPAHRHPLDHKCSERRRSTLASIPEARAKQSTPPAPAPSPRSNPTPNPTPSPRPASPNTIPLRVICHNSVPCAQQARLPQTVNMSRDFTVHTVLERLAQQLNINSDTSRLRLSLEGCDSPLPEDIPLALIEPQIRNVTLTLAAC